MTTSSPEPSRASRPSFSPPALPKWIPRRAHSRLLWACAAGLAAWLGMGRFSHPLRLVAAWDAFAVTLLGFVWTMIWHCDAEASRLRAGVEDPGRNAVWALVLFTSTVSFFAAGYVLRQARTFAPGWAALWLVLCLGAVVVSWLLSHTAWTLRYAHLYYRDDTEGVGGLEFAGGHAPSDFDFAYFAFTVGMAFQTSDVSVSSPQIRRAVLLHALLSFAYNTAIIALALNLAFTYFS